MIIARLICSSLKNGKLLHLLRGWLSTWGRSVCRPPVYPTCCGGDWAPWDVSPYSLPYLLRGWLGAQGRLSPYSLPYLLRYDWAPGDVYALQSTLPAAGVTEHLGTQRLSPSSLPYLLRGWLGARRGRGVGAAVRLHRLDPLDHRLVVVGLQQVDGAAGRPQAEHVLPLRVVVRDVDEGGARRDRLIVRAERSLRRGGRILEIPTHGGAGGNRDPYTMGEVRY